MNLELKYLLYILAGFFLLTNTITGLAVSSCDMRKRLETEKELAIKTEQLNSINELMQEIDKMKPKKNKYNPTAYHISKDIYQPFDNTKGGMKYLAYLLMKYKNKRLALYAYYTGETNLNRHLKKDDIPNYLIKYTEGIL